MERTGVVVAQSGSTAARRRFPIGRGQLVRSGLVTVLRRVFSPVGSRVTVTE